MLRIAQHASFPYVAMLLILLIGVLLGILAGTPVWAAWIQTPTPPGYENAIIHDMVLLEKSPSYTPLDRAYVGWAVGQIDASGGALIMYYNGVSWSVALAEPNMGILRSVDARYDGTIPEVIAVGDYTEGDTSRSTHDYNTILYGRNGIFSLQAYQGTIGGSDLDYCNPATTSNCKSWIGDVASQTQLRGVAFSEYTTYLYNKGVCQDTTGVTNTGILLVGQERDYSGATRGAFLVAQRCMVGSTQRMWVLRDQNAPDPYYQNFFSNLPDTVNKGFTTLTNAGYQTYFLSAQQNAGIRPRVFKFSMQDNAFGLREIDIGGHELDNRSITDIAAIIKPGPAITTIGAPWYLYLSTATAGSADPGVVHMSVSGDTVQPLSDNGVHTRLATGGASINAIAAVINYRGGNMLANSDFHDTHENNAGIPEVWQTSGNLTGLDAATFPSVAVVDNPTQGTDPGQGGPTGTVLKIAEELMQAPGNTAAVQLFTNETFTKRSITNGPGTIAGPFNWDVDAILGTSTGADANAMRVMGFFEGTPGTSYDFRLTLDDYAGTKAQFFVGQRIANSNTDFTTPIIAAWPAASQVTVTNALTLSATSGADILDSATIDSTGPGAGIKESAAFYPFAFEFARSAVGSGRHVLLEWRVNGSPTWESFNPALQTGNHLLIPGGSQQAATQQYLPQTRGPKGPAYRVQGKYRIARAPDAFLNANDRDPRKPVRGWGGVAFRCEDPPWGDCGFNWDLFVDPKLEADTLSTDGDTGGWRSFDFILAKTVTTTQTYLSVVCLTEYGTVTWCGDLSVEPVQEVTEASTPQYRVYAVSGTGKIFSGFSDDPAAINLHEENTAPAPLRTIAVVSPVKGMAAGDNGTFVELVPGLVQGWGWVGATTSGTSNDALGWISFSCADRNLCNEHQLTYGVDVSAETIGASTRHPFTGAAWFGTTDLTQVLELPGELLTKDGYCYTQTGTGVKVNDIKNICTHAANPTQYCLDRGYVGCNTGADRCEAARSFGDCDIECSTHPLGCSQVGWLSFERNTDPLLSTGRPPCDNGTTSCPGDTYSVPGTGQTYTATVDMSTGLVEGWGRFLSLARGGINENTATAGGWMKFLGPELSGFNGTLYECQNCLDSGLGYQCAMCFQPDSDGSAGIPAGPFSGLCTASGSTCEGRCSNDLLGPPCTSDTDCTAGAQCVANGWCDGNVGVDACFTTTDCAGSAPCTDIGFSCPAAGATCYQWGVGLNTATGQFNGFAYSDDIGWIDMSRVRFGNQSWFQALQSNIFSAGNVGDVSTPKPAECNATYRITAVGQLVNVCSAERVLRSETEFTLPFEEPNAENLILPSSGRETVYGAVDIAGIVNDSTGDYIPEAFGINTGRYGSELVDLNTASNYTAFINALQGSGLVLDNKVYFYCGDTVCGNGAPDTLTLSGGTLLNGGVNESGNGTLVVYGDLAIDGDISYQMTPVSALNKLASLGIIVFGDVTISPSVTAVSAALYNLGNPLYLQAGDLLGRQGGKTHVRKSSVQYVHRGLMIAREFLFERTYGGPLSDPEPAERVIYDGRVVSNPPPGFTTLRKALPTVRQVVPSN